MCFKSIVFYCLFAISQKKVSPTRPCGSKKMKHVRSGLHSFLDSWKLLGRQLTREGSKPCVFLCCLSRGLQNHCVLQRFSIYSDFKSLPRETPRPQPRPQPQPKPQCAVGFQFWGENQSNKCKKLMVSIIVVQKHCVLLPFHDVAENVLPDQAHWLK